MFTTFLDQLLQIDGIVVLAEGDRYSVRLEIGVLFEPLSVATRVAECFRCHFYPEEELRIASEVEEVATCDARIRRYDKR